MLDRYVVPLLKRPLKKIAILCQSLGVTADLLSISGFIAGLIAVASVALAQYEMALFFLVFNRLADGVDGELARLTTSTDAGGFLDITLDFIFYAMFPVGFAIANPELNALPAAVLVASFVGTGASFLAFASMAEKRNIAHPDFGYKGFYYINGLAEGTETVLCFALMCLLPSAFPTIAWIFAMVCIITAINRVVFGYLTLKRH